MPFLAPLVAPLVGGLASAGGSALIGALSPHAQQPGLDHPANYGLDPNFQASQNTINQQIGNQSALQQALINQNGIGNQQSVFNQQQGLSNMLLDQSMGNGPNPALDQLNQTTGANVANQAALMAGQRGASVNPALIARMAAQQGAATQQQAVGQGATLRAQQQLAAQQALQNQQANMANLASTQTNQGIQNQQSLTAAGMQNQSNILNGIGNQNNANASMQNGLQAGANQIANQQQGQIANGIGGAVNAAGAAAQKMLTPEAPAANSWLPDASTGGVKNAPGVSGVVPGSAIVQGPKTSDGGFAFGGLIPKHFEDIGALYHGDSFSQMRSQPMSGQVPGKAKVAGDSPKNDTVKANLSPGEFVLPRSVMNSKDPAKAASSFVAQHLKKSKGSEKEIQIDFKQALQRAIAGRKNK